MKRRFLDIPFRDVLAGLCFLGVTAILCFSAIWAYKEYISSPPYVDPEIYPIRGIDISAHNGEIDFQRVAKSGMRFAFIKATEGEDFNDRNFRRNYDEAKGAGLKTGIYHFFRFDKEGVPQAVNFLKTVGTRKPELGLVIDVEKAGNHDSIPLEVVRERLFSMVDYLNLLGHRVMIYTNHEGYYDYVAESLPGIPLWICRFSQNPINAEWTFWQYDHHGKVDGIKGDTDLNAFCGTEDEWKNYLDGGVWPYASS